MGKAIGIDLGTTNSCVAVVEGGQTVIIPNDQGERTTPSVVAFTKAGERLVGSAACRQAATNADRTISSVKRHMGTQWGKSIDGKEYNPQEISAMVLRKLKADAENYLGQTVTDAVITVPAYFNDIQRQATRDAGRIAGLNVLRIINEPTSAALAYGLDHGAAQKIMVFDLGGGTFDVSIIEISEGVIEVLATAGDNRLGGDDFDQAVVEWAAGEFRSRTGVDLHRDLSAMARLREAAEQAKKELSGTEQAVLALPYITQGKNGPLHLELLLTRAKFDSLTAHLVERTEGPVRQALSDADLTPSELGMVLLVGGSTRIPAVQAKVRKLTGKEPSRNINPDECVAMGAAIQGQTLSAGGMTVSGSGSTPGTRGGNGILLLDVTPLSLSIETVGGVATRLVERNSTLPVHYSKVFTTAASYQSSVEIHVLQGERPMARDNKTIGKFRLNGIQKAPAGVPQIEVTFDIDANGILKVSARDQKTGKAQSITITANEKMSEAEIEAAIRDAERYASQDSIRSEGIALCNEAGQHLARTEQAMNAVSKQLSRDEKKQLKNDISALRKLLNKKKPADMTESDLTEIRSALERLKISGENANRLFAEKNG